MAEQLPPLDTHNPQLLISGLKQYGRHGKLSDLQTVLKFIAHQHQGVKATAIQSVSSMIRENLICHYHSLETGVRTKLGALLESLDPGVIDEIGKDLYSESNERRLRAIQILGLLKKNPRIREILSTLVKDRDVKVRATAVNLLGKVVGPNEHELILSLLNDPDKRVRANTIEALESLGNKRLVPILLRFRKDACNRIRGNIIKALFNLGFREVEPELLDMIAAPNDLMKASALWVISQIDFVSPKLEDASGRALLSENEMVTRNARNALSKQGSPRALGYLRYLDLGPLFKAVGER